MRVNYENLVHHIITDATNEVMENVKERIDLNEAESRIITAEIEDIFFKKFAQLFYLDETEEVPLKPTPKPLSAYK